MKILLRGALALCLLLTFAACDDETIEFGSVITLSEGETIVMADKSVITLKEINDSRCPADATCVWEGRADVLIKVIAPDVEDEIRLNNVEKASVGLNNYQFDFIELTPFPGSNATPTETVLKFKISLNQ